MTTNPAEKKITITSITIIGFLILLMLLFTSIVVADGSDLQDLIQTGNTKPTIEINYNESIDRMSLTVSLNDSLASYNDLFDSPIYNDSDSKVKLQLLKDLKAGRYTFSVKACDIVGNCNAEPVMQQFEIQLSDLNISLVQPRFAIFRTVSGNLTIATNRESRCRYGIENKSFDDLNNPGINFFVNDDTYSLTHSTFDFRYVNNAVFFNCQDKYGKSATAMYVFKFDPSIPYIKVKADNVYAPPIESNIHVESVNTEVQCKYSKDNVEFGQMKEFTGFNDEIETKYQLTQDQTLTAYDLADKKTNRYYVQCISKSGVLSEKKYVDIVVDTERGLAIEIIEPDYYVNKSYIQLNVSTSVAASCFYKVADDDEYDKSLTRDTTMKTHTSSSINYDEGTHTIYVRCNDVSNIKTREETKEFIVDLTRPVVRNVRIVTDDNSKVNTTTITVRAESEEGNDGSGINRYEYVLYNDDPYSPVENLTTWRYAASRNGNVEFTITYPFVNDSSYYVKVRAIDNAGWTSDENNGRSNTVKYSPGRGGGIGVICYDIVNKCGGLCNKCDIGGACNTNFDCISNFCFIGKCANSNCSDTVKNGDETDSDCGGSCDKCDLDRECLVDADCQSGNCINKRCSGQNSCRNSVLDAGETDIDCGGQCDQCDVGKVCEVDSDCVTNYCKVGEVSNKCFKETKDTDGDSINDENDNCQDEPNQDQADLNKNGIGDACDPDKDGDGIPNDWETANGLDPMNSEDALTDPDGDGLTNLDEYGNDPKTDPNKKDTDGDGYSDFDEIKKYHTDPTDPESRPRSILLLIILWTLFTVLGFMSGYYLYYSRKAYSSSENTNKQTVQKPAQGQNMSNINVQKPAQGQFTGRPNGPNGSNQMNDYANMIKRPVKPNQSLAIQKLQGIKPGTSARNVQSGKQSVLNLKSTPTQNQVSATGGTQLQTKSPANQSVPQSDALSKLAAGLTKEQVKPIQKSDALDRLRGILKAKRSKVETMNNELGTKKTASKDDDETIDKLKSMVTKKKPKTKK